MATDIKFVYIATGSDPKTSNTFTERATSHANWMVKRLNARKGKADSPLTLPALVRFIHFDWEHDRIQVYEHAFPEKGLNVPNAKWKDFASFVPTEGTAAFDPKTFITKSATVGLNRVGISIVDVYRAVRKAPRGTVLDVSIYSHAFIEGPVLESTGDSLLRASTGEPIRTDSDLDGRVRSDFTPHMGEKNVLANKDALKDFREGFATDATFRVFGCHVQDIVDGTAFSKGPRSLLRSTVLQVITAAYTRPFIAKTPAGMELRRRKKPATVPIDMGQEFRIEDDINDTDLSFTNFNASQLKQLHYGLDPVFFPDKLTGALKFDRPFTEVIKFIARQTKLGYIFKAAEALPAVTCFGAVPGTGGSYEVDGHRLMFVPKALWEAVLLFFTSFMGIKLDERNYGRFDADGVAAINHREIHG